MKIPKSVKIGGVTFKVVEADDWTGYEGDTDGQIFYDKAHGNTIYIHSDMTPEGKSITLIHEAMHAMNSTMNHEFLDSLAQQLYQFLNDNQLLK